MQPEAVPGVQLGAPIPDRDSSWYGHTDTGVACEVVVLAMAPEPEVREAAVAALGPLRDAGAGHRQPVWTITPCRSGVAVVAEQVAGTPVGQLTRLSPAQAVTLGLPVARELAALQARGMAFGADAVQLATEIVVRPDGRPVLTVAAWARRRVHGGQVKLAADLTALRALLSGLCPAGPDLAGRRFAAALQAPDCAAMARRLRRAAVRPRPLPVGRRQARLPARPSGVSGWRRWQPAGRWRGPAVLLTAVVLVALVGWVSARGHARHGTSTDRVPARSTTPAALGWDQLLSQLDHARAAAFAGGGDFTAVDAPGGSAATGDATRWAALQQAGVRARGLLPELVDVVMLQGSASHATLAVTDRLPAYQLVDATGAVRSRVPGRGLRQWRIDLVRLDAGWRVHTVAVMNSATAAASRSRASAAATAPVRTRSPRLRAGP